MMTQLKYFLKTTVKNITGNNHPDLTDVNILTKEKKNTLRYFPRESQVQSCDFADRKWEEKQSDGK